jgi:hypothetical protein
MWFCHWSAGKRGCIDPSNDRADTDDGEEKLHGGLLVVWFPANAITTKGSLKRLEAVEQSNIDCADRQCEFIHIWSIGAQVPFHTSYCTFSKFATIQRHAIQVAVQRKHGVRALNPG